MIYTIINGKFDSKGILASKITDHNRISARILYTNIINIQAEIIHLSFFIYMKMITLFFKINPGTIMKPSELENKKIKLTKYNFSKILQKNTIH